MIRFAARRSPWVQTGRPPPLFSTQGGVPYRHDTIDVEPLEVSDCLPGFPIPTMPMCPPGDPSLSIAEVRSL